MCIDVIVYIWRKPMKLLLTYKHQQNRVSQLTTLQVWKIRCPDKHNWCPLLSRNQYRHHCVRYHRKVIRCSHQSQWSLQYPERRLWDPEVVVLLENHHIWETMRSDIYKQFNQFKLYFWTVLQYLPSWCFSQCFEFSCFDWSFQSSKLLMLLWNLHIHLFSRDMD